MFVMAYNSTQVVLDAPQVEKRIYVIDLPPKFLLLIRDGVRYVVLLHVPSVHRVVAAV